MHGRGCRSVAQALVLGYWRTYLAASSASERLRFWGKDGMLLDAGAGKSTLVATLGRRGHEIMPTMTVSCNGTPMKPYRLGLA